MDCNSPDCAGHAVRSWDFTVTILVPHRWALRYGYLDDCRAGAKINQTAVLMPLSEFITYALAMKGGKSSLFLHLPIDKVQPC